MRHRVCGALCMVAAAGMARGQPEIVANWVGPNNGLYSAPGNWDIGAVPINLTPFPTFDVRIGGAGDPCVFDLLKVGGLPRRINRLTLTDRTLQLQPGTGLLVVNQAAICGHVYSLGGDFFADSMATMDCGRARAWVDSGGTVRILSPAYAARSLVNNRGCCTWVLDTWDVLRAEGTNSLLDLHDVVSFDDEHGQGSYTVTYHRVLARDGGTIDLRNLTTVAAPSPVSDITWFHAADGGRIVLDALATTGSAGRGGTQFTAERGSVINLGSLRSAEDTRMTALEAGIIGAEGPGALAMDWRGMVNSRGCCTWVADVWDVLKADGVGSVLRLPSLVSIDDNHGQGSYTVTTHRVLAQNGGVIDLSGLRDVGAPSPVSDVTSFHARGGAEIALDALETTGSAGGGTTEFLAEGGSALDLPSLRTAEDTRIFALDGGAVTAAGPAPFAMDWRGMVNNRGCCTWVADTWDVLKADGGRSVLNLRSLASIDDNHGQGSYTVTTHRVLAQNGGVIDLSGLLTVSAPSPVSDATSFHATGGAGINLDSLVAVGSVGGGRTAFIAESGSTLRLPTLQAAENATMVAIAGGSVVADGPAALEMDWRGMVNSRGCCTWVADVWDILRAANTGSVLDLAATTRIDDGHGQGSYTTTTHRVLATDGGMLLLPGLTEVRTPAAGSDRTVFQAELASILDMSALSAITTAGAGPVEFHAQSGSQLLLGNLAAIAPNASFRVEGAGSTLASAGLSLPNHTTLAALVGTTVRFTGDFSFTHTDESRINLAAATVAFTGSSPQTCEIGGLDFGVNGPCFLGNSNFGFGRLEVGAQGLPSHVTLADAIDNGNRAGGRECLYLWGNFDRASCAEVGPRIDGLAIQGGATLDIARYNVYAWQGGAWTHLNAEFNPCERSIPYDGGVLAREVCYPDFDQSTGAFVLDIFDFLAFQNAFAALSPCACDCDTSTGAGVCDIFDFLCFQNKYIEGCP